jgi:hypothetical protein
MSEPGPGKWGADPFWCGYPGCRITGDCADGICVIAEAQVAAFLKNCPQGEQEAAP